MAGVRLLVLATCATSASAIEIGSFAPAPTPSADIENLTARGWEDKVRRPVNSTAYIAIVLFHRNEAWAQDYFRMGKKKMDDGLRSREFKFIRPVRYFMMDCTNQVAKDEPCWQYTRGRSPSLYCFRGIYALQFNRTWYAEGISYWLGRITRPAYLLVESMEVWLEQEEQLVPCFLLIIQKSDPQLLGNYEVLAMELIEFQNFHLAVDNGGGVWKDLPGPRPSIHLLANKELNLEAPPLDLAFDQDYLRSWAIISSLPNQENHLNFYMFEVIPVGWSVVVLRHHNDSDGLKRFQQRTQAMRETLRFSFAHLDVSTDLGNYFARTFFPLLAVHWEDYLPYFDSSQPSRIFVFTKTSMEALHYWDSPDFPPPELFELDDVEEIMKSLPLDNSDFNYWLGWFIRFERFGSRSWLHRLIWLFLIFCSFYSVISFYLIFRAATSGEASTQDSTPEKVKKPKKRKTR